MAVDPKGLAVGIVQVALRAIDQTDAADMLGDLAGVPRRTPEAVAYERFLRDVETKLVTLRRGAVTSHPSQAEEIDAALEQVRVRFETLLASTKSVVAVAHLRPDEFRALVRSDSAGERAQFGGVGPQVFGDALAHITEAFIVFAPSLPQFATVMLTVIAEGMASVQGGIGHLEANDARMEAKLDSALSGLRHVPAHTGRAPHLVGMIPSRATGYVDREVSVPLQARLGTGKGSTLVSLTGLRGAGKSQVAADVAHRCRGEGWSVVAWVNADSRDNALADLAELADRLGATVEGRPPEVSVGRLYGLWAGDPDPRRLVVLDNVVDRHDLDGLLPPDGVGSVVITTADRSMVLGEVLDVGVFTVDQARDYLEGRLQIDDQVGASAVGRALGWLPLALAGAAWTIGRRRLVNPGYGYDRYLEELARQPLDLLLGSDKAVPGYPRAAVAALMLAVEAALDAAADRGLTQQVLGALSFLNPSGVTRTWFDTVADEFALDHALITITDSCLAQASDDAASFIMHRLVARVVRDMSSAGGWDQAAIATASQIVAAVRPLDRADYWGQRTEALALAAHVRELLSYVTRPEDYDAVLSAASWSGSALNEVGASYEAIAILQPLFGIAQAKLGRDHPDTLTSQNNLAYAYRSVGDLDRAIALFEKAAVDQERVLGPDHPSTLTTRNNLADAYRLVGDMGRAIPLFEKAVADRERVLGPQHPSTLTARNNLADSYRYVGDLGRAIPLFKQTVADQKRVLGRAHPSTLTTRNNLALAYQSDGDLARAIVLFEQNLADLERVLGPDHPSTLSSRNNLALAYQSDGDLPRAIVLFEQVLADLERVLGPDHPSTLSSRNNLAFAYQSDGDLARAIPLLHQTLADQERVMGPDHPDTLSSRHNLAGAYYTVGDLGQALPLLHQTLADRERVLGLDHPDTLLSRDNLANALRSIGVRAIALLKQTLTDQERVLGLDHPDTLASRHNLAYAYRSAGDLGRAVPLYERNLTGRERVLGLDHPDTMASRDHLGGAYRSFGDLDRAIVLYERNLTDQVRVLGLEHQDTLWSRENLALALTDKRDLRAQALAEFNVSESLRLYGPDDARTLDRRDTLALVLLGLRKLDEGITLLTALAADCRRILGDHPVTRTVERRLAKTMSQ